MRRLLSRSLPLACLALTAVVACDSDTTATSGSASTSSAGGAMSSTGASTSNGLSTGTGGTGGCTVATDCTGAGDQCFDGVCCDAEANVCGSVCCKGGAVCLFDACVTPGVSCHTTNDCGKDEYCETALGDNGMGGTGGGMPGCTQPLPLEGKCLPLPPPCDGSGNPPGCVDATCEYHPPVGALNAIAEWTWGPTAMTQPDFTDVWSTPAVGRVYDGNCDGKVDELDAPVVVFVSGRGKTAAGVGTCCQCTGAAVSACLTGVLRVLDGRTGEEVFSLASAEPGSVGFAGLSVAIGDLDHDGRMEIVAVTGEGYVVVLDDKGTLKMKSNVPIPGHGDGTFGWGGGLAIADMNGDGSPEIAYGATVFTTSGGTLTQLFNGAAGIGGGTIYEALSTFVDLNGDGQLELLAGRTAYTFAGTPLWNRTDIPDGFPAIGDFDTDGKPDVAIIGNGKLIVLRGLDGTTLLPSVTLPGNGAGGPPTVADFDGDGKPEIGVAQQNKYTVLKPDLATSTLAVLWQTQNHDLSSSVTGSSVFDFEGDGKAEVIYADECFLWVFDGQTGAVRFAAPHTSFTATEASVVADIDGDGHAEMLMVSNGADPSNAGWKCLDATGTPTTINGVTWTPSTAPGQGYRGVVAFGDSASSWVGTRTLWSEHTYHVSNVCDSRDSACVAPNLYGDVPKVEQSNWTLPWLNNFRQNVQDTGLFDAPDAQVSLKVPCATPVVALVSVRNGGLSSLPTGVPVAVFKVDAAMLEVQVGTGTTTHALSPGQTETLSVALDGALATTDDTYIARVVLDPVAPKFHECNEGNNASGPVTPSCVQ